MLGQRDVKIGNESRQERSVRILKFGRDHLQNTDGSVRVDIKALSDFLLILNVVDDFAAAACRQGTVGR